ncbi:hypothetical protein [Hufsiella ginkgonis]|uniref:Uncharacterized protein n=1 Tax=Hufsiella ginkgonis TaxID=2695274 RepID=A0A7K1XTS6_9SPHI|nr:hypothetical protein [Hufsiella ginkgonis]MXV14405.1 hypothetical protein [Hufsiella ginkgonis]
MRNFLQSLAKDIQKDLGIRDDTKITKANTFAGARNIGDEHAWFAI